METDLKQYLRPEFVSRLHSLDLQARLVVEGYLSGMHKSPYHGFSVEFAEYRPYITGEPLRHLDWKKYARSDRLVVREYEDNTNLKAYLVVDTSCSMAYAAGQNISKFRYSVLLAASLAYLLLHQRDAVGLSLSTQSREQFIAPRTTRGQLFRILSQLHNAKPEGSAPMAPMLHRIAERIGRRGLVIIFSDLMEEAGPFLEGIKHLRYLGHEVIVFHVFDRMETDFNFKNTFTFEDMESGERLPLDAVKIAGEYKQLLQEHLTRIRKECLSRRVDYCPVVTEQSFEKALTVFLQKRAKIH